VAQHNNFKIDPSCWSGDTLLYKHSLFDCCNGTLTLV
jgi:hypothetical protein